MKPMSVGHNKVITLLHNIVAVGTDGIVSALK